MTTSETAGTGAAPAKAFLPADTGVALPRHSIGEALHRQAVLTPERVAVADWLPDSASATGGRLRETTYADLHRAARGLAQVLLDDARPGRRVGIWSPNRVEWVVAEYAAALAGLVLVPVNPALTEGEVEDLLRRSACTALLAGSEFRGRDLLEAARGLTARLPGLQRVLELDGVLDAAPEVCAEQLPEVSPDEPFLVQYTSGTTGAPKGAVLTHGVALGVGVTTVSALQLSEGAVYVSPLPLHHVGASVCGVLPALACGGTFVTTPSFDPSVVLRLVQQARGTLLGAVPTMLLAILDEVERGGADAPSLQTVQIGGSTVAPALVRRAETLLRARVVNAYGQSEAPSAVQTRLEDSDEVKALTIGRPGPHREARIVRTGTPETADIGEEGELCLRSPLTMTGYLDDPDQTAGVHDAQGWLHTGDLCSMDAAGNISIHGRLRDVVIRGGENVYPAEVENVLLQHPAVADVAVVGAPDERWGEQVAAFVRFRPGAEVAWADLERYARGALAGFKVPRVWRRAEQFPLTASGKVQKYLLRQELG